MSTASDELTEARHVLARRVGLPQAAPIDAVGVRLRERTARWASEGLTLELEFVGIEEGDASQAPEAQGEEGGAAPASATLRTPGREPQQRELRLLEALAQAALSGATAYASMGRAQRHIQRLRAELPELGAQAQAAFADAGARDRVQAKLDEAAVFLPELEARAREVGATADTLISVLEEAANTASVAPGRRRPREPARPPGEPRAVPPAAPATAPPSASPSPAAPPSPTASPSGAP